MSNGAKIGLLVFIIIVAAGVGFFLVSNSNKTDTSSSATTTTSSAKTVDSTTSNATDASSKVGGTSATTNTTTPPVATGTSTTASSAATTAKTTTITYNGTAFSPASVTIAVGDSVDFTNSSTSSVNVASDPHPSHTNYPALNLGLVTTGKTSSKVAFTKAGTYGYHNHLDSTQSGTIIVK